MSIEFDNIRKQMDQSQQNQDKILKDIYDIKQELRGIEDKIDIVLEILNTFSIMLIEENEDLLDNETWVPPEQDEDWNSYDDDDEEI